VIIVVPKNMFRFKKYITLILNPSQPPFTKGGETLPPFGKGDLSASGGLRGIFKRNIIMRIAIKESIIIDMQEYKGLF